MNTKFPALRVKDFPSRDAYLLTFIEKRIDRASAGFEDCHLWVGEFNRNGYGRVSVGKRGDAVRRRQAHRAYYELRVRTLGKDEVIDHLCRNRACMNLLHMEPVTWRENAMRGHAPHVLLHFSDRCGNGHLKSVHGYITPSDGRQRCRECLRVWRLAHRSGDMRGSRPRRVQARGA